MLARSGKVSMATKKRSGEEINDRQILCGMGIKLRRLYSAAIFLIPICISFDTAEKRRYATYL
ncbi:hypothetical protein, partial [Escherichia coli]|uniref:hypothetical protein n=1 Tax=Escherichia coli TaxID=562 RepID=UPI003D8163AF